MIEVNYNNFKKESKKETGFFKPGHELQDMTWFIGLGVGIISIIVLL